MLPSCRSESQGQLGEASFLPGSFTVLAAALVVPGTGPELDTEVHGREAVAPVSDVFQSRLLSWPWQASEKLHAEHLPWEIPGCSYSYQQLPEKRMLCHTERAGVIVVRASRKGLLVPGRWAPELLPRCVRDPLPPCRLAVGWLQAFLFCSPPPHGGATTPGPSTLVLSLPSHCFPGSSLKSMLCFAEKPAGVGCLLAEAAGPFSQKPQSPLPRLSPGLGHSIRGTGDRRM